LEEERKNTNSAISEHSELFEFVWNHRETSDTSESGAGFHSVDVPAPPNPRKVVKHFIHEATTRVLSKCQNKGMERRGLEDFDGSATLSQSGNKKNVKGQRAFYILSTYGRRSTKENGLVNLYD
jgi:hypothetical protein